MTKARKSHSGEILLGTLKPSVPLNQFSSFIDLKTNLGTSERKELVKWKRFKILAGEGIIESTRSWGHRMPSLEGISCLIHKYL